MTEAEWNACTDPRPMLEFLRGKISERKLRLFLVACCRRSWPLLGDPARAAVETAESYADGQASRDDLRCAESNVADSLVQQGGARFIATIAAKITAASRLSPARVMQMSVEVAGIWADPNVAGKVVLLRELFGPLPIRPIVVCPDWRTATVKSLGDGIYQDRAFDRLPILADALEDAGCTDQDILAHCRGPGLHVRGCWVVDLLTGRE